MIHAFALEPQLVATWAKAAEFRFFEDKFGLGTPRVLLELPAFNKWRRAVIRAAEAADLEGLDTTRLTELLGIFDAHRHRRADTAYDGLLSWLENAEREYDRRKFAAILATSSPRGHEAVLLPEHLTSRQPRWTPTTGASPARTPEALAAALTAMLTHCRELHLVDPHFAPSEDRYRKVLTALVDVLDRVAARST